MPATWRIFTCIPRNRGMGSIAPDSRIKTGMACREGILHRNGIRTLTVQSNTEDYVLPFGIAESCKT